MRFTLKELLIFMACFSCFVDQAFPQSISQEGPTLGRKVRNLGMGNTGVALYGDHDSSPFYNPAGLNDLEKGRFQFFTNTIDVSRRSIALLKDIKNLAQDVDDAPTDADRTRVLNNFIQDNTGEFNHFRYSLEIFNYSRRNFAAGLLMDERLDLSFRERVPQQFDIRNLGDISVYAAGAHDFWDKLLQVGITLKPTVRFSLNEGEDQEVTFADVIGEDTNGDPLLVSQFKNIYKKRHFGLVADLGLKSNLAIPGFKSLPGYSYLKPQFGLTWQDIGSPSFGSAPGNEHSISVGFAVHPDVWKLKNAVAIDFRDLNQERDILSKFHFGLESKLPWVLTLRAGVSQGYFSGGATFDLWIVKLDGALYFEETGIRTVQHGNMRWAATLSFNI